MYLENKHKYKDYRSYNKRMTWSINRRRNTLFIILF